MAVKFLSEEWAAALNGALNSSDGFKNASSGVDMTLGFTITDTPDGEVKYYLKVNDGSADAGIGEVDGADVSITSNYDTAAAIAKGEQNTQTAFMTGKLKVAGNLAKLMMHQGVISAWGAATEAMDVDY